MEQTRAAGPIAVIGCGKIGEALVRGMLESGFAPAAQITASAHRAERARYLEQTFGIAATTDNAAATRGAATVVLALKPNVVLPVLGTLRAALSPQAVVISLAAAISVAQMEAALDGAGAVIRAMPNTPALIRHGMTALARGSRVTDAQMAGAMALFQSVGRVVAVEERHLDAVTGLSASGPAFVYMVIEAMAEGGVRAGLPREMALELAAQTVVGGGRMVLETGEHPAKLKDNVTTPAGCTVDGLLELEAGGLRVALIKAVSRAAKRASELGSK